MLNNASSLPLSLPSTMADTPVIEPGIRDILGRPGFRVRAVEDEIFVNDLKQAVPSFERAWCDRTGSWWVAEPYRDRVLTLLLDVFASVLVIGLGGEPDVLKSRDGTSAVQERLL